MASTVDEFYIEPDRTPYDQYEGIFGVTDSAPTETNNEPILCENNTLGPFRGHVQSTTGHDGLPWKQQLGKTGYGILYLLMAGYHLDTGVTVFGLDWRITIDGVTTHTVTNYERTGLTALNSYAVDIVGAAQNNSTAKNDQMPSQMVAPLLFTTSIVVETKTVASRPIVSGQVNSRHVICWN